MHFSAAAALVLLLAAAPAPPLDAALAPFVADAPTRARLSSSSAAAVAAAFPDDAPLQRAVLAKIAANLAEKRALPALDGRGFAMSTAEIEAQVVAFEIWKMRTFLSAGVFPKRYFGYFDEKWDTAARERELRRAVICAVDVVNAQKGAVHVSEMEVAVTFIAEGGAILLREKQASLDAIHPVYDIGLDDIATGFARAPGTVAALDDKCGMHLAGVITHDAAGAPLLARGLTLREGLAATALMYEYEKGLARAKLAAEGGDIAKLSLPQQFVAGSLVYNSGLLFSNRSRALITSFTTAAEIYDTSVRNAKTRWLLPVWAPDDALAKMRAGADYPEQPTSWSGMYHVLQRYGGFVALQKFSGAFDDAGAFRKRD